MKFKRYFDRSKRQNSIYRPPSIVADLLLYTVISKNTTYYISDIYISHRLTSPYYLPIGRIGLSAIFAAQKEKCTMENHQSLLGHTFLIIN